MEKMNKWKTGEKEGSGGTEEREGKGREKRERRG